MGSVVSGSTDARDASGNLAGAATATAAGVFVTLTKLGASFGVAAESDVFFLEGCLEGASQACNFGARMATRCVNEYFQDHQGLEATRFIDVGTLADSFSAAAIDQAYRDSGAPPEHQGPPPPPPARPQPPAT